MTTNPTLFKKRRFGGHSTSVSSTRWSSCGDAFLSRSLRGTYASPYNWRFAHFRGLNSLIALEQTYYDPIMGVQLMLLLQPLPSEPRRSAITAGW
jgi:hypothetical protein